MAEVGEVTCPGCGAAMTRHADKVDAEGTRDAGCETFDVVYCCPQCGETLTRRVPGN